MKQVNLNFELKDLNEKEIGNAGVLLAGLLMSETKGDAVKFFDWAMSFNKKEVVSMDASDLSKIKTLITETEKVTLLAKAQILKYLEKI